jgi:hypothetical protein
MAGSDSQKLQDKLQEMVKLLTAGRGNREDTAAVLTEAAERLNALEVSNKRLREEARGPAQIAHTKFMSSAIKGYLSHKMIALEFTESQWQAVMDNCEDIADAALVRWKLRWVDGISPVKRPRKGRADFGDSPPRGAESLSADPPRAAAHILDQLFDPAPRQGGPRMVDAVSPPPKPATASIPEEKPSATQPLPATPHAAHAPQVEPPPPPRPEPPKAAPPLPAHTPQPKERQPGDD